MAWILIGGAFLACLLVVVVQFPAVGPRSRVSDEENDFAERVLAWARRVSIDLARSDAERAIITRDERREWEETRPAGSLSASARKHISHDTMRALELLASDLPAMVEEHNARVLRRAVGERRTFVRMIEQRPLTPEQSLAVATVDNRVQVLAAAGSGKTSVLVARAAWAIKFGGFDPSEVLLLAYNRGAADELQRRVDDRLEEAGIDVLGLRASTFHSFGLAVIGKATGERPRLATWLDAGEDVAMVSRLVDRLRDTDPEFRQRWDLYRLLFARTTSEDEATPDGYDRETKRTGFTTMHGELVRSQGERLLADWLFLNGVEHFHEAPYAHQVAAAGGTYRPTFHYPEVDAWHEHWTWDDGDTPHGFAGYAKQMDWKRAAHREHGTTLLQSTTGELFDQGFARLEEQLTELGLTLEWDPDRFTEEAPVAHEDIARLMRTFMVHVKSSGFTPEQVDDAWRKAGGAYRTRLFLDLYWPVHEAWQEALRKDESVDFEDMLLEATRHVEAGTDLGVRMVLVDEFQDTSPARARLVRALVNRPHRFLMTVGDDWQAINRYAGADISVMTDFQRWFGEATTLTLQTTFRCSRTIADTAGEFVQQNPRQIRKVVRTHRAHPGSPVMLARLGDESELEGAVNAWLDELSLKVPKASVLVLGRYGFEERLLPAKPPLNLDVRFRTVHGAKGLEADHVLVPRMLTGRYGFPSNIADDPVLDLVTSRADQFAHGEERRLFYVALTRAKHTATLMTVSGKESPFVTELVERGRLEDSPLSTAEEILPCPSCGEGSLVPRNGPYGAFLGCSTFPTCRHTEQRSGHTRAPGLRTETSARR